MHESATKYWFSMSLLFAAMTTALILLDEWFVLASFAILIGGMIVVSVKYGQLRKDARTKMQISSPALPMVAISIFAAALLIRATDFSLYAAPLFSVGAGIAVYFTMKKANMYYPEARTNE